MLEIMKKDYVKDKIIKLYSKSGWKSLFAHIRFWDAPYDHVDKIIPKKAVIIDLGCGEGLFSNYIALNSKQRKVYGVELNKSRIKHADKGIKNAFFKYGDITKTNIPKADIVILMHVLHHLDSFKSQVELIKKCNSKLKKDGKIIIIEIQPEFSLKFFITYITDHFFVPWLFEKKTYSKIYFRKRSQWKKLLNKHAFYVQFHPLKRFMPFSHMILECKKK